MCVCWIEATFCRCERNNSETSRISHFICCNTTGISLRFWFFDADDTSIVCGGAVAAELLCECVMCKYTRCLALLLLFMLQITCIWGYIQIYLADIKQRIASCKCTNENTNLNAFLLYLFSFCQHCYMFRISCAVFVLLTHPYTHSLTLAICKQACMHSLRAVFEQWPRCRIICWSIYWFHIQCVVVTWSHNLHNSKNFPIAFDENLLGSAGRPGNMNNCSSFMPESVRCAREFNENYSVWLCAITIPFAVVRI